MFLRGIGTVYRTKLARMQAMVKGMVTPLNVSKALDVPIQEAGRLLSRWSRQGWVKKVKRGVYLPVSMDDMSGDAAIEDPWILAEHLFAPGYVGGFSAIKHWDLTEQLFETTTFLTTKTVSHSDQTVGHSRFHLKTVRPYKLFGTKVVWRNNIKILVSDPSKTIVDLLNDPALVGGMAIVKDFFLTYHSSSFFDLEKIIEYADKMRNKTIFKRLGFLMETIGYDDLVKKYNLVNKISKGYSIFDPLLAHSKIVTRWKLKIPDSWGNRHDRKK